MLCCAVLCPGCLPPSPLRSAQRQGAFSEPPGGSWQDVQGLLHHWPQLEGGRKATLAQMAVLLRWGGGGEGAKRRAW